MIIEMRTHRTKPGKRADFLETFRSRSMPAQAESLGIRILGPFLSVEDPVDVLFFMRGFPDLESREVMKMKFYEGPFFNKGSNPSSCRCWKAGT